MGVLFKHIGVLKTHLFCERHSGIVHSGPFQWSGFRMLISFNLVVVVTFASKSTCYHAVIDTALNLF